MNASSLRSAGRAIGISLIATLTLSAAPIRKIEYTDTKLKNGLRVIVSEDHSAPVFSIVVNYNVGSRVERKGAQAVAKKYLDPTRLQIVAVGDAQKVADILKKKGELETYDADGKPVK
jgi:predicted Zn-dependent peptidase